MHETAAHLVDAVLPVVPFRQWVLSLPRWARFVLAKDAALASRVLAVTLRAIFADYRRRARSIGVKNGRCGAVTFVQRFGDALNLNVHFHCVLPDGVFVRAKDGTVEFVAVRPPDDEEIETLLERLVQRLERFLRPRLENTETADELGLAEAVQTNLHIEEVSPFRRKRQSAFVAGYSIHAGVHLHENDREGLERLCRYGARPPFSLARLAALPDGRLSYRLRRPRGGQTHLLLAPTAFLHKLACLIPPPRHHLVRFHGVFGPNAAWRPQIVPVAKEAPEEKTPTTPRPRLARIPWADLLQRVYRTDVLRCERCGSRMKVLAFLSERAHVKRVLTHLKLPTTAPSIAPARGPPQLELSDWSGDADFPQDTSDIAA